MTLITDDNLVPVGAVERKDLSRYVLFSTFPEEGDEWYNEWRIDVAVSLRDTNFRIVKDEGGDFIVINGMCVRSGGARLDVIACISLIEMGKGPLPKKLKSTLKKLLGDKYPKVYDPHAGRETTRDALYSADWHIGHKKIVELRGFTTLSEHNRAVILSSLFRVAKGGVAIVVGDLLFGPVELFDKDFEEVVKDLFPYWEVGTKLPFIFRIVLGNHDSIPKLLTSKYIGPECISAHRQVKTSKGKFVVTHIPVAKSEFVPEGRWYGNIHGHLHTKKLYNPYYCVSWEQNRGSVTIDEMLNPIVEEKVAYVNKNRPRAEVAIPTSITGRQ